MSDREDMVALADEYERSLNRMRGSCYQEYQGSIRRHELVIKALRSAARTDAGYGAGFEAALNAATVSCSGTDITIQCADHDVKDAIFNGLESIAALPVPATASVGWQPIETAPQDGTAIIGAFWSIRWADSHRKGEVVQCWYQPEFEAFISSCREMTLAPGLTFENGSSRELHSPVIEPVTHWMPLPAAPTKRSAT